MSRRRNTLAATQGGVYVKSSSEKYFVENFHLHSPVEEFQEFSRLEVDRLRDENPNFDESIHRQAIDLVQRKLRTKKMDSES